MKTYLVKLKCGVTGTVPLRLYPRAGEVVTVSTGNSKVTGPIAEVMRVR